MAKGISVWEIENTCLGIYSNNELKHDKTKNICSFDYHCCQNIYWTMSDICWQKQTSTAGLISRNQAQFMSRWGSYEQNQSAVFSSVGMTRGELATVQPPHKRSKEEYQPGYTLRTKPGLTERAGANSYLLLLFLKVILILISELHLTHKSLHNLTQPCCESLSYKCGCCTLG